MPQQQNKNFGLDIEREIREQDGTEYLGGVLSCIAEIPIRERKDYLPYGEIQRGKDDTMDCATRAPLNILEAKLSWLLDTDSLPADIKHWLIDNGYVIDGAVNRVELSDAFIAILSGTTKQGNSLKAPLQTIHEFGVIPKHLLPLKPDMTFEEYHDPKRITQEMKDLGQKFLKRLKINYGKEYEFKKFIKTDMISVGGYAWPEHTGGVYPRVEYQPNHAFVIYELEYFAFDNYRDSFDGDFIKNLAPDYSFLEYGYRLTVNLNDEYKKKETEEERQRNFTFFGMLKSFFTKWLDEIFR